MKRIFSLATIFFLTLSCSYNKAGFWEGYTHVFNKNGEIKDYTIEKGKPYVINFAVLSDIENILDYTPRGKIDSIIKKKPNWEFVFYCECEDADSTELMNLLKKYGCSFPVIIDPKGSWSTEELNHHYNAIGVICNKKGKILGVSVIGTVQSFFDQKFAAAKSQIRYEEAK